MSSKNTEIKRLVGIYEKAINAKFDWEEKIQIAKKAGYDFIELSIDESNARLSRLDWDDKKINKLRNVLFYHNFYFNSMCLSAHRRFPFGSKDEKVREKAFEIMEKALILAKKLGIRIIQIAAYDVYYEKSNKVSKKRFIEGMKKAAQLAQKYSITLAFETMDTAFAGTITKCMNFLKEINMPNFYIYPDIGNLSQFTKDVENEITLASDKIVAFHFKDTTKKVFKKIEWGQGSVNFPKALRAIKKINFKGPMLIEMWSENKSDETLEENVDKLVKARKFYNLQWKKAKCE
ncbi:L-ribulose-5-phosphate 3-epimerase [Mesomycoplasma neurolyticum]|uniref:L-ribulose-5-phosphate 3-epimerase n=1 Tax=Mesomycoplasma neurolyticum TaxID=2120 RepID=A0A449A487_9BACT|nr:L-ribulose-5-phosphate 3-epimerase ulaE [Mesomycoplasma neurolyticum]